MTAQVKLGIVGVGNMGKAHARHALDLPNTRLAAICDHNPARLEDCDAPDDIPRYSDYARMLDDCPAGRRHHRHAAF